MGDKEALDYLDVGIGIIGFFAFAFLVVTVVAELTGADALGWALTLLVFVLILGALVMARRRRSAARQPADPPESTTTEQ
jgi:Flp pilus assembly protein TadB